MKAFMDQDFLLETETGKTLYHQYAENLPIIDYHCHIDPSQIAQDKHYDSITEIWLGGDHYKWRAMRANGVPEHLVTGGEGVDPYEIFESYADTLPRAIGNPLYHWTHLELKNYFGITTPITKTSARDIYDRCGAKLAEQSMGVRGIIEQSKVTLICTTDDPVDDLRWHKAIKEDPHFSVQVLPAFRPDKAMNIDKEGFGEYIQQLGEVSGVKIKRFRDLKEALTKRIDFFHTMGGRVSDHALITCCYAPAKDLELDAILGRALDKGYIDNPALADKFRTGVLVFLGGEYAKRDWTMQIHFGCLRNNSSRMFEKLGPDTGYDSIANSQGAEGLIGILNALESADALPKTILYSLNDSDNAIIASAMGCFQTDAQVPGKMQLGSAWWFQDTKSGMEKQLTDLANLGVLGNFVGMLTDSRSFLSYARHEYFRRILCNWMGKLVDQGQYPADMDTLGTLVKDICYNNAVRYFGFDLELQ